MALNSKGNSFVSLTVRMKQRDTPDYGDID